MRPSSCPACTRLPSATARCSSVPPALARSKAVCGATSGPENSTTPGSRASAGCTTSRGANSSGTSGFLSPLPSLPGVAVDADFATAMPGARPGRASTPACHAPPTPAVTTATPPSSHHVFFIPSPLDPMRRTALVDAAQCRQRRGAAGGLATKRGPRATNCSRRRKPVVPRPAGAQTVSIASGARARAQRSSSAAGSGRLKR